MSTEEYTLTYFDARGRGEIVRLTLTAAGVNWKDQRIRNAEWPDIKPKTPLGQLPFLETKDGATIAQSNTIVRYIAREHGLCGKTSVEEALTDMVYEHVEDAIKTFSPILRFLHTKGDQETEVKLRESFREKNLNIFGNFERLLTTNKEGSGFFVGDSLTYADLAVMNVIHWIPLCGETAPVAQFPKLQAHTQRIEQLPNIAKYLQERPVRPK